MKGVGGDGGVHCEDTWLKRGIPGGMLVVRKVRWRVSRGFAG